MNKVTQNQAELQLQLVRENMTDGWCQVDPNGFIVACNNALASFLGYTKEQLIGMSVTDISTSPEMSDELRYDLKNQLEKNGFTGKFKNFYRHRSGAFIPVAVQLFRQTDETGAQAGYSAIVHDRSDSQARLKTLDTLINIANAVNEANDMTDLMKCIREELSKIIDTTNFYIALYDDITGKLTLPYHSDRKDTFTSFPAGRTLTGYLIETGDAMLLTESDIERMAEADLIDLVGATPSMWLGAPLIHRGKTLGVVAVQSYSNDTLFTEEDLDMLRFVSSQIAMAIWKRQTEEDLLRSEEQLRITVDGLDDIVHVVDHDMRILLANQAMHKFLNSINYDGPVLGENLYDVFKCLNDTSKEEYKHVFSTGQICQSEESNRLEIRTTWTRTRKIPIHDKYGNVLHILTVVQDVTDQHDAERALLQAQKMEAMGALAGGIAHDFNNILSVILGYSEMAGIEATKPNVKSAIQEVTQASKRAKELVSQILAFSRQEEESLQPVNLGQITREALRMLRASLPSTIHIKRKVSSKSYVLSDPTRLHQIIMNLCTNAFHAMQPDGGILSVEVEDVPREEAPIVLLDAEAETFVKLSVSDTGKGMPPDIQERIFEPYFTTKPKNQGTGLGLAIIHSIVTALKGDIQLESKVGEGTRFTVYLPVTKVAHETQESESPEEQPTSAARILFVDDEPTIVSLSRIALKRYGYEVTGFTNSQKAITEFEMKPDAYDLIISDLTMPRPTGIEMVRRMRKIRPDIPVILCTGYNEMINDEIMKKENIEHLLFKPIPVSSYVAIIEKIREDALKRQS